MLTVKTGGRLGEWRHLFSATAGVRHGTFPIVLNLTFIKSISLKPLKGESYFNILR